MSTSLSKLILPRLAFGERPFRLEPGGEAPGGEIYSASPSERESVVRAAYEAGITFFHAAYEREAVSLALSLRSLGIIDKVTISVTNGEALDHCADSEEGAAQAIRWAIYRQRKVLSLDTLPLFSLYGFLPETHTLPRLAGARKAMEDARAAGEIQYIGVTCYGACSALADAIEQGMILPDIVLARFNFFDQEAMDKLFPVCRTRGIPILATQPFSWIGDIPFVRFPNTWRLRNLTRNFYGFTAGQAHLHWILAHPEIDGVLVSMQTLDHVKENFAGTQLTKTPDGLNSLFESFVEAITNTLEGWRGLLSDESWEYRMAAEIRLRKRR